MFYDDTKPGHWVTMYLSLRSVCPHCTSKDVHEQADIP